MQAIASVMVDLGARDLKVAVVSVDAYVRVVTDLVGPQGGEVYGAYPLFVDRARQGMTRLFHDLPAWLTRAAGTTAT